MPLCLAAVSYTHLMKITDEFLVKGYYRNYDGMHLLKHARHNTCPDMMKSIGKDENGKDVYKRQAERPRGQEGDACAPQGGHLRLRKESTGAVSYTHLDVYKRQLPWRCRIIREVTIDIPQGYAVSYLPADLDRKSVV